MRRLLTWAVMATVVLGLAGDLSAQTAVEDPFGPKEESIAELIDKVRSAWSISRPKALERLDYAIAERTESRDGPVRAFYGSNDDQRAILETGIPTVAGFLRDKNAKVRACRRHSRPAETSSPPKALSRRFASDGCDVESTPEAPATKSSPATSCSRPVTTAR